MLPRQAAHSGGSKHPVCHLIPSNAAAGAGVQRLPLACRAGQGEDAGNWQGEPHRLLKKRRHGTKGVH